MKSTYMNGLEGDNCIYILNYSEGVTPTVAN